MKKLRLEDLAVESFVVSERASGRGTVAANEATTGCPPGTNLCTEMEGSCDPLCGASHPYQRVCAPMTYRACDDSSTCEG
jgi:hypothetical protein